MKLPKKLTIITGFSKTTALFLIILLLFLSFNIGFEKGKEYHANPKMDYGKVEPKNKEIALISTVDNFETLSLDDLPNFTDIRNVYPYKSSLIIVGAKKVMEYDPLTKTILRINTSTLACAHASAKIDNFLYVGCFINNWQSPSRIYKVNLESGEIENTYEADKLTGWPLINISLASQGKILWGSSREGVFKLDTISNKVDLYELASLKFQQSREDSTIICRAVALIAVENNQVKVFEGNCDKTSIYNEQNNNWDISTEKASLPTRINKSEKDFKIDIPNFVAYSEIIGNKRYLFADDGIYILYKNALPTKLFDTSITYMSYAPRAYITKNNDYALLVDNAYSIGESYSDKLLVDTISVNLINLETGEVTNLVKNHSNAQTFISQLNFDNLFMFNREDNTFREENSNISLWSIDNRQILTVDIRSKTLDINN